MPNTPARYGVVVSHTTRRQDITRYHGHIHDLITSKEDCNLDAARRNHNLKKHRASTVEDLIKTGRFHFCLHCCK